MTKRKSTSTRRPADADPPAEAEPEAEATDAEAEAEPAASASAPATFAVGDRVKRVGTGHVGEVAGEPYATPGGALVVPVSWDGGRTSPAFVGSLVPA